MEQDSVRDDLRELAIWRRIITPQPCIRWIHLDPNHDAAMRIGSEAPGWGPILQYGLKARSDIGSPPPRIVLGNRRQSCRQMPNPLSLSDQGVGRRATPAGTSPVVTRRQSAMSSLRANATIIVLRLPRASSVRARYHCVKALFFWNIRKRHASWIMPRRTRALPVLASPLSRRLLPLSSGEPVRPA